MDSLLTPPGDAARQSDAVAMAISLTLKGHEQPLDVAPFAGLLELLRAPWAGRPGRAAALRAS